MRVATSLKCSELSRTRLSKKVEPPAWYARGSVEVTGSPYPGNPINGRPKFCVAVGLSPSVAGRNTAREITVLNVGTREAGVEVVNQSWCQRPIVLQARVVRLEDLVPNSLRNERIGEAREAAFHARQFSKCVTEVERLSVSQVVRDLGYVVVRLRGAVVLVGSCGSL